MVQDGGERAHAAASIATHLVAGDEGDEHLGDNDEQRSYAVKRLVRGLCSSRGGARQGFATGLTMVNATLASPRLHRRRRRRPPPTPTYPSLPPHASIPTRPPARPPPQVLSMTNEEALPLPDVLAALLKETETSTGMRGAEERDLLLGRLFGLGCCARSEREFSTETTTLLTRQLLDLHLKRKWMKEATLGVLADLLDQVSKRRACPAGTRTHRRARMRRRACRGAKG